jgi:hypothetical protein
VVGVPTRIGFVLAVAALVVALPTAAGALPQGTATPSAVAASTQTYPDSTGEDPASPDMTSIVVSNDDVGGLTFRINTPNRPQFTQDMAVVVFLDSDANQATGDPAGLGTDYLIEIFRGEVILYKWDGVDFAISATQSSLNHVWSSGATIRINASDLSNTRKFTFEVITVANIVYDDTTGAIDCSACARDFAPAVGLHTYTMVLAKATLVVKKVSSTPKSPAAGKRFTFRMTAARSDTGATIRNGKVTCKGRVGTTSLKAKTAKVVNGAVTCVWVIPAKSKGKRFRGSAAVQFEGLKASRSYSGKIR